MRVRTKLTCIFSAVLVLFMAASAPLSSGEERVSPAKTVREYRLGEIVIRGEKEKPQVYFIIPKAKFSLQNIAIYDDNIWEIRETELHPD